MILDELVALLAFDVDDKNLKAFNDKIGEGIALVAGFSATVVAAGASLFSIAKLTADAGEEAAKMAEKYGISAQAYQELQYAARGEAEALSGSLLFLAKAQNGVIDGNKEQTEAFRKLGVTVKDTNGKLVPTDQLLMKMSDRFKTMEDGPEKAGLAMEVFGKSGAELIPFLNQGSEAIAKMRTEANELGFVLGEQAVEDAQAFQDVLDDTKNMLIGIRNTIGAGLMPIITKLGGKIQEYIKINRVLIATRLEKFFAIVADYAEKGFKILNMMVDSAIGLANVFGGLENVLKMAAYAMLAFASAKILFTIGSMIQLVQALGTAFTIANAKALLIPILIGAAVVALGLIIEDIVAFFQGKDSVTGVIVEKFKAMFSFLEEKFAGLGKGMQVFITILLTPLRMVLNMFRQIGDIIDVVRGKMSLGQLAKNTVGRVLSNFGVGNEDGLKGALGFKSDTNIAKVSSGLSALNNSPNASGGAGIQPNRSDFASSNQSNQNNIEMPITVNVGEGADPFAVGKEVSSQTGKNLDGILRGTQRSFSGARSSQ